MALFLSTKTIGDHSQTELIKTPVKLSKVASVVANIKSKAASLTPSPMTRRKALQKHEERPNIQELRKKYETAEHELGKSPQTQQSPKFLKKSKVKQIAQLFNDKITQIVSRDSESLKYVVLKNEQSPESKPAPKPAVKPRTKLPIFRPQLPSPVPSPRPKRKQLAKAGSSNCLVAEDVFRQLTVKDKALLYNKFVEDMSKRNPQFGKHAELLQANAKKEFARGEVVNEKQESVRHLTSELEAKFIFPKLTISPLALQHLDSAKNTKRPQKAKEAEDIPSALVAAEELIQVSSLTVMLKPIPGAKKRSPRSKSVPRNNRLNLSVIEPSQKRNNTDLRSSLPIEAYAPPKKIRRTRTEHLTIFENQQLERLFYSWLKEKNGVAFDITSEGNAAGSIEFALAQNTAVSHSDSVDKLLEETIVKLESVKEKHLNSPAEETSVANVNVAVSGTEVVQTTAAKTPIPTPRKTKKQAPAIPAQPQSTEESESGLSTTPKAPENELQKCHDHNPNALSEHQLRVQASLQRLNIPDWYRQYNQGTARSPDGANAAGGAYKPGNFTRKRTSESGRWTGLNSKTTSLSSLGSQRSDRSPLLLSPSAHSHHGGQSAAGAHHHPQPHVAGSHSAHAGYGTAASGGGTSGSFSRWSTSHLNSSQTSPSCSQRGSFSRGGPVNSSFMSIASGQSAMSGAVRSSFRQPYLGWRSQEKLSQPRTPHERLASTLLAAQQQRNAASTTNTNNGGIKQQQPPVTPEIQSSIKEVTSAIVHYVNDQTQQQRSRSTSPNSRKCWLESSFVGTRPLDSPQTPVIESTNTTPFSATTAAFNKLNTSISSSGSNYINYTNNSISSGYCNNNSSATSSIYSGIGAIGGVGATTVNADVLRMNGLSCVVGAPERSLSSASLEDVLASLLGLPSNTTGTGASTTDAYTRSTTADSASESLATLRHMPQTATPTSLNVSSTQDEQQRLRRRSEGDAPKQQQQQQKQQQKQQQIQQQQQQSQQQQQISYNAKPAASVGDNSLLCAPRRVSLGDSSDSNNKTSCTSELPIKCRNNKCDQSATAADAKKHYKSCHNCAHLYCSRECRRAHWEKHRKACLHSRASNLCRQVLATCKDDIDSQRHLSLLARKGFLAQGRGVVRLLLRSADAAEGFIKHGFQCMGEASYVRWPDLMPAEMGLELYSELLKLSTEYKPDSKMLIYVAICVVSEAPGTAQAPVKWERQLVSRCAKLKLCKSILSEVDQQQQQLRPPVAMVAVAPEPSTEILILTFNPHSPTARRDVILANIITILSRRGVLLRKHYPEIYQRMQTYAEGQTDRFNAVTLHPRDSQTGQSFVCIIMPVQSEIGMSRMPSVADGGNRVHTIDVGATNVLANMAEDAGATVPTPAQS